jgi:hypothetical protein
VTSSHLSKSGVALCGAVALLLALGSLAATQEQPLTLINGRPVALHLPPLVRDGHLLLWARDLERLGLVTARWDPAQRVAVLATSDVTIHLPVGRPRALLTRTSASGEITRDAKTMPYPAILVSGRLMVPLEFVCQELGLAAQVATRLVIDLRLPEASLSTQDHPTPGAVGAIAGTVLFGDRPLPHVVLRLVRAEDNAFLPERRAVAGPDGAYHFPQVPPGQYRVYAYVGDNPDYFNRATDPLDVTDSHLSVPPISMGRIIAPVAPQPGTRVSFAERLTFAWTSCPGAATYELSAVDPATQEEVVFETSQHPQAQVPGAAFTPGREYHWRILALTDRGEVVGATPSAGADPWSFVVLSHDNAA